jgi:hypothetical protein
VTVELDFKEKVSAMSEFQKVAIGLLGLSHPEIYKVRRASAVGSAKESPQQPGLNPTPAAAVLRGLKFAFAALVAGSRAIPLGDNGRLTRELGEYGTHLKGC